VWLTGSHKGLPMRLAIIGQQAFGKSVLEAFIARGATVAGVFCAPEKPGAKPDPLRTAAEERGVRVFQLPSLKDAQAAQILTDLKVDLGVMAYVVQFAPQALVNIPKHGTIQYHPSLLPRYRGPSSINWPIIKGDTQTGLTIFRPSDGLDEGPIILQKTVPIGPDDTLGSVYFDRLCNPAPGAWTTVHGQKVRIYDLILHRTRTFGAVPGKPGEVCAIGARSIDIAAQGGRLELLTVRIEGGAKMDAAALATSVQVTVGATLES